MSAAPIRVMLVDDAVIVRQLLTAELTARPGIAIAASAANGEEAIPLAAQHQPDVIVLDIEMPVMDGLTALPKLRAAAPGARIIIVSGRTRRNAALSLQALALGASECIPKPTSHDEAGLAAFYRELGDTIVALAEGRKRPAAPSLPVSFEPIARLSAIAIAASTGGPQALAQLLCSLKGRFEHIPIFITQHMPAMFTTLLAEHLAEASGRPCREGRAWEIARPGCVYLAPGDYHMTAERRGEQVVLHIDQNPPENFCRPSADPMLRSLAAVYGSGLLAIILTGMGSDGLGGAREVVKYGGQVIAQDETTSVVWGMPRAVVRHHLCRAVLPLPDIAPYLMKTVRYAL